MLLNIQALRAVAAFLVVFVHLQTLAVRAGYAPTVFEWGNSGVDLFFVISGVIMVVTTERRETTAGSFLAHRVARVAPLYWLVTLVVTTIALAAPALMGATRVTPETVAKSLAFIPFQRADGFARPIVFVGWTLNYEMAFYVLFAAGMFAGRRMLGLMLTLGALLGLALLGWLARPAGTLGAFYTQPIILEFGMGMVLGALLPRAPSGPRIIPAATALALAAFGVMLAAPALWPGIDRAAAFGLPAMVIVACALVLEKAGWAVTWPLAKRLGDASYATYLTHFFVTQAALKACERLHISGGLPLLGVGAAALVAVAAVGVAVNSWVEKPLNRAARRTILRSPLPQAAQQA